MILSWSSVIALTLLAVQNCVGDTSCILWSSSKPVVQRGSSFVVYCNFKCKCRGSMYSDHPPTPQEHKQLNSTTIYLNVTNITGKQTYSCGCRSYDKGSAQLPHCRPALDPCGLDISAGYPPDPPKITSCIYEILKNESGVVKCSWDRGRDTHLLDLFVLQVRTVSGNHTQDPVLFNVSSQESLSVTFSLPRSVQSIRVQVQTKNPLGSANSSLVNYTISDIVRPSTPVLEQPECSSRHCIVKVEQPVKIQHLQIQFRAEQEQQWATHPDSVLLMSSRQQAQNISSLEPYRSYVFRARSKFSTGLWSSWSSSVSSWTEEEAPAQALDVWFPLLPNSKFMKIYWKESNTSISSGRVLDYRVKVQSRKGNAITSVSAGVRGHSFSFCADCNVTVWARTSKGLSPPATITTHRTKAKSLQDVQAAAANSTVAISWRKPEAAPAEYVVEWYPEGMLEELRWVKLDQKDTCTVLTGVRPWECYEGAVYTIYNKGLVSRTKFKRVATLESAPKLGPSVQKMEKGDKVEIIWSALPRAQRRGCITKYTIYLECYNDNQTHMTHYNARGSERTYTIKDLSPGRYSVWMSASTAKGEGPASQKIKFYIQETTQLPLLLIYVLAALIVLFPSCCLWKSSVRFRKHFHCFIPDVVPDPANSKWAKECTKEKGKMNLLFPSGSSSLTSKEDETILVNVEELSKQICDTYIPTNVSSPPPTSLSPDTEQTTLLYPPLPYIKSFSHDSDSSDLTQTSEDTTVDYITSHGQEHLDTYDQEDEDEPAHFFPSLKLFIEPLEFGGKLTLDAVKINCGDL